MKYLMAVAFGVAAGLLIMYMVHYDRSHISEREIHSLWDNY